MDILLIPVVVIAIGVLLFGSRRLIIRMFIILAILLAIPGGLLAVWYYQNSSTAVVASAPERYNPDVSDDPEVAAGLRHLNEALDGKAHAEQKISEQEYARRVWQSTGGQPFGAPVSMPSRQ